MKKTISEHITHYLTKHHGEEEKIIEFAEFIDGFFEKIPEELAEVNEIFEAEIEVFTDEIDEEMISEIVKSLRTKDGNTIGAKWTIDETKNVVKQYDVKAKIESCGRKFDCHKFWLALNYVYAVHYSINRTLNGYVDLAIDEYCNTNICFDAIIRKISEKI
jgi:hypothetical protein